MTSRTIQVMVVDDDDSVRATLVAFLEDSGFRVQSVASAEEALSALTGPSLTSPVDVMSIDIRLPGMDGDTLIRRVLGVRPDTRFVVYTGSSGYALAPDLVGLGVRPDHVFRKPLLGLDELVDAIRDLAGSRDGEGQ